MIVLQCTSDVDMTRIQDGGDIVIHAMALFFGGAPHTSSVRFELSWIWHWMHSSKIYLKYLPPFYSKNRLLGNRVAGTLLLLVRQTTCSRKTQSWIIRFKKNGMKQFFFVEIVLFKLTKMYIFFNISIASFNFLYWHS